MIQRYIKKQGGMTLIEAVIGLAIFAMFALIINTIFLNVLRAMAKEEALKEIKQNGERAMQIMTSELRSASRITSACDGTPEETISFQRNDGQEITYSTDTVGGVVRLQKEFINPAGDPENLTGADVEIVTDGLMFDCTPLSSGEAQIQIDLTLEHARQIEGRGDTSAETTFSTTVVTR